ncbi:carbon-nitrogen hydrolase family protein [Paenarthrobacter sp. A20]|uniref:carbon-nitrogen hydrolase family protein n=1 Tax=Paenarthrobacter sp. A20 TaxID=2817891 RepID=UPI0020A11D13|nr:carbon-nitrogen hydrolase family protein [Paenarthrobacter sp. A20]
MPPQAPMHLSAQHLDSSPSEAMPVETKPRPGEEPSAAATLLAAVVQYEALLPGVGGEAVEANVAAHVALVEQAHARGARLVLFPELSLTGYELGVLEGTGPSGRPSPWLSDGDTRLQPLRDVCARTQTTAIIGAAWREADQTPRLASLIIGPDGTVKAVFKTHLHGAERELFVRGSGPGIVDIDGWRVALAVCADAAYPTHAGAAAEAKADVYAVSALYSSGDELRLGLHMGARSMDHRIFGLLANLGGQTPLGASCGLSGAWGPDGAALAQAAGTGTEVAVVALDRSRLHAYRSGGEA